MLFSFLSFIFFIIIKTSHATATISFSQTISFFLANCVLAGGHQEEEWNVCEGPWGPRDGGKELVKGKRNKGKQGTGRSKDFCFWCSSSCSLFLLFLSFYDQFFVAHEKKIWKERRTAFGYLDFLVLLTFLFFSFSATAPRRRAQRPKS